MNEENNGIDFSAIANLDAVEAKGDGMAEVFQKAAKASSKNKFNFVQAELVQLPSHGKLYQNTDSEELRNGHISLKPMTVREEEILTTSKFLKTGSATRMVIQNCIAGDADANDILLFDSNYILFKLRQMSYGDDYSFKIKCENSACEREFEHKVVISKLAFEEMKDDVEEPIVVKLPISKYTVKAIFPRLMHSEAIYMRNNSRKKTTDDFDKTRLDNLVATTIEILDNKGKPISPKDWEDFYEALPAMDRAELTAKTKLDTGIDRLKDVKCPYCGTDYSGSIPIGVEFFRF